MSCAGHHRSLGVHLSFVRSTTLDSWSEDQLQLMSQGGNQRARTFFKQHGWDEVGSDKIEAKYTSRAAQLYRKQLEKDVIKALKGETAVGAAASSPEAAEKAASLGPAVPKPSATAAAAANKSRLVQHHHRKPAGKGGLGVKKMVTKIDDSLFDQAPAQEEAEQPEPEPTLEEFAMPTAGSGGSRFNLDAMEERKRPAPSRGKDGHLTIGGSDDFFSNPMGSGLNRASSIDKPTSTTTGGSGYSNGVSMFGRKQAVSTGGGNNAGSTLAQEKFGNAKSISSAAFFDDGQRENDYEKQSKLAQFQGSQAISSDAYFGRESSGGGGGGGVGSGSNMDMTAADLVSKISITAKQDLGQLKDMAGQASAKLSQMAQSFMRDLQGGY
jgi:ADP-ribosylation factor GTPase-activating protein 2/3